MSPKPLGIRRHAIFKNSYRRTVASTPDFHNFTASRQWAALRAQVIADTAAGKADLLEVMESREARRDEVLEALEDARQATRK